MEIVHAQLHSCTPNSFSRCALALLYEVVSAQPSSDGWFILPLDGNPVMPKMDGFHYENHWSRLTLTSLNVLGVLDVLNVLTMLNVLNIPKDASLACWAWIKSNKKSQRTIF